MQAHAITVLGRRAQRALSAPQGTVQAVFERSLYVASPGGMACLGPPGLGAGPLNALLASPTGGKTPTPCPPWPPGLVPGLPVTGSDAGCTIGDLLSVSWDRAERWAPAWPAAQALRSRLPTALPLLLRDVRAHAPAGGVAPLLLPTPPVGRGAVDAALHAAAGPALAALHAWIAADSATLPPAPVCGALLGLGSGLTPSGDDVLGGAAVLLRTLERHAQADALAAWVTPLAGARTHPVSAAHLEAALAGEAGAPLHALLTALATPHGAGLERALHALDALGHTSGWDLLAGVVLAASATLGWAWPPRQRA